MTAFFFRPKLQQPGITLREELERENPTYFQSAVILRWGVTVQCEFNGLHFCLVQAIIMTEMEMIVFCLLKTSHSGNLTTQRMEDLRACIQIVNIDFHQNTARVTFMGISQFLLLRTRRISHWKRLIKSQINSGCHHRNPQTSVYLVYIWY